MTSTTDTGRGPHTGGRSEGSTDAAAFLATVSLDEVASYLHPAAFPARQDDLLALLISKRAPSRLLWRIGQCSPTRRYASLDALWNDRS